MLSMTWGAIMDLIGGIKHMENRLGGRRPNHGRAKPVHEPVRRDAANETCPAAAADDAAPTRDFWIGRKVDTTA